MRIRLIAIIFSVLIFSCRAKDSTPAGVENDLKTAMQTHLYSAINNDSSNVKYRVLDVTFFEESDRSDHLSITQTHNGQVHLKHFEE